MTGTTSACELNFRPPETLSIEAARLFDNEIRHKGERDYRTTDEAALAYTEELKPGIEHLYAITNSTSGLLAAARVTHNSVGGNTSYISHFAVGPNHRKRGHGSRLVQYIGSQAIMYGDDTLQLYTEMPEYFSKLGFHSNGAWETGPNMMHDMTAVISTILASG